MYKYEETINQKYAEYDFQRHYDSLFNMFHDEKTVLKFIIIDFRNTLPYNVRPAFDNKYGFTRNGLKKIIPDNYGLEEQKFPFALSNREEPGLYFIGQIGLSPEGTEYYLIKIGGAYGRTISQRVNEYATYNPMIYHNDCVLTIRPEHKSWKTAEDNCHEFLAKNALKIAQKSKEWFYVTKEVYYQFCDLFTNEDFFYQVANGEC